jgi:uncharacterized Zn finger protein (UPF0148 family)
MPLFLERHCGKCHKDIAFCPKCKGVLGHEWGGLTCGMCGYGRHTIDEFHELRSVLEIRND